MPTWTSMRWSHFRHLIRMVLPATFSSGIWYFAWQLSQLNFIERGPTGSRGGADGEPLSGAYDGFVPERDLPVHVTRRRRKRWPLTSEVMDSRDARRDRGLRVLNAWGVMKG